MTNFREILAPYVGHAFFVQGTAGNKMNPTHHAQLFTNITTFKPILTRGCNACHGIKGQLFTFHHMFLPVIDGKVDEGNKPSAWLICKEYTREDGTSSYGFKLPEYSSDYAEIEFRKLLGLCRDTTIQEQENSFVNYHEASAKFHEYLDAFLAYSTGNKSDWKSKLATSRLSEAQKTMMTEFIAYELAFYAEKTQPKKAKKKKAKKSFTQL